VVFSLGDVFPLRDWRWPFSWTPRLRVVFASGLALLVLHAVLIPGIAVWANDAGQRAYDRHDLDRAESMYRLAAAIAPQNSTFLNNAGIVYFDKYMTSHDQRWLNYAQSLLVDACLANPYSDLPGHALERVLIQRLTGDAARDKPVHLGIIEIDRHILKIDPFNPFVRKNLAEALYYVGDHQAATDELNKAIAFEPNYVPAYLRLSDWLRESGDTARGDKYTQIGVGIAMKYKNEKPSEPYEVLLLRRPMSQP
jgi:tetratricopeptide (TPR) repeat protein